MRRAGVGLALAIGLCVIALRAPLMGLPLERDEGGYAYVAWRLAEGEMPYRDWFEQKPPGIFLAYAAALLLPIDPVVAIRLSAALASALASVALFALVQPLLGLAPAALAALLLGWLSADPMLQGSIANTELFMLPGMIAAAALSLSVSAAPVPPRTSSLGLGALLGIATLFKPVAAANVPFFLLVVALRGGRQGSLSRLARFAGWAALGGLLVWLPVVLWLWSRGALAEFADVVILHNFRYAGRLPLEVRAAAFSHYVSGFLPTQGPAWAAALLGLILLAARRAWLAAGFLAGFALANALGTSATGLFFPHYFQQTLPAVAALGAAAALGVPERRAALRIARAVLVGCVAFGPLVWSAADFWRLEPAQAIRRIYPGNPFEAMPAIAMEVQALTQPGDTVFLFGAEPEILFYARRVSASRYIYLYPLDGDYPGVEARRNELIREVEGAAPALIAWMPNQMTGGGEMLTKWFRQLVAEHYHPHAVVLADRESRGRVVRVASEAELREASQGRPAWARLYVRTTPDS
jgi:hypothetical protein